MPNKQTVILEAAQEPETIDLLKKPELLPEIPSTTNLQLEPDLNLFQMLSYQG